MAAPSMKGIFDDAPAPDEEEPMMEEESDLPPEFLAAYEEWEAAPSAESMKAMIEACVAHREEYGDKGGTGLALLLGPKGKGRK